MLHRLTATRRLLAARLCPEEGQTMAEYAVVLAVITIGIVVALVTLAGGINNELDQIRSFLP